MKLIGTKTVDTWSTAGEILGQDDLGGSVWTVGATASMSER